MENNPSDDLNNVNIDKPKSVKKNYIYNLLYQLFLLIVPLATTPYVSRVLTANGVGQYSFSFSIATYFTIFAALGFGYYAQREIAKYKGDKEAQAKSFWEINICRLIPVAIAIVVNIIICFSGLYGEYKSLMLIFTINIFAVALDISFFYQGKENFGQLVIRNFIVKSLSVAAIFIFVKTIDDLPFYALINSLSVILGNIIMWVPVRKYLVRVSIKELRPLKHMRGTIILFLPTIAVSIYTILDKTIIGLMVPGTYEELDINGEIVIKKYSDLENGYYDQSEKIVKMAMTVLTAIGTVMIPRNSSEIVAGHYDQVRKNIKTSCSLVLLLGIPIMLGIIAVSDIFVPVFFGDGYEKCSLLMKVLSPIIIIIGFSNVFGLQYLIPAGKDRRFTAALISGAAINLLLNLIFIKLWWSIGAAIATVVAELTVTCIMAYMVRDQVNIFKVLLSGWKYYIAGGIMFVSCFFVAKYLDASILNLLIVVAVGVAAYFLVLIILKEKFVISTLSKIINKIKRVRKTDAE